MFRPGTVWGIDIAESALKAVKLRRAGKSLVVADHAILRYDELGAPPDARKGDLVLRALGTFLSRHEVKREHIFLGIPSQNVFSRFIGLPPVEKRRMGQLVEFEARQQIPFDLNEVIWDYQTVKGEFVAGEEIEIGLFAVRREVIEGFLSQASMVRQRIHGVQIGPLAVYNFVRRALPLEKPMVVIDIGAQSTDLIIIDGPKFWLRNLPIAGNNFTNVIQRRFNMTAEEAENVKRRLAQAKQRAEVMKAIQPVMRDLVAEIQRSVGYYKSLASEVKFEEVLVLGEGLRLHGLQQYLTEHLQYKVRGITELEGVTYAGAGDEAEFNASLSSLGVAMGLAVQGLGESRASINLLPEPFIIERELRAKRPMGVVAVLLIWLCVGALYVRETRALTRLQKVGSRGENVVKRSEKNQQEYNAAKRQANTQRLRQLEEITQGREYWPMVLDALTRAVPQTVFMENLRVCGTERPGAAGSAENVGDEAAGMAAAAGSGDNPAAGMLGMHFVFRVSCDKLTVDEIKVRLKERLEKATVYPEDVPLFKEVATGPVWWSRAERATEDERETRTARTVEEKKFLRATVACRPYTWGELDELRKKARAERKQRSEKKAP